MSEFTRPIIAAIPTWNMAEQVINLVPELQEHDFDGIAILDDASTDNTPARLREAFGDQISIIEGRTNLGASGNRNRVLGALAHFGYDDAIISFIDADTHIPPTGTSLAEQAVHLTEQYPEAGIIGGKVLNPDGSWGAFNYGPTFTWDYIAKIRWQIKIEQLTQQGADAAARALYAKHARRLQGFPNIFEEPQAQVVGWAAEAYNIIEARKFVAFGGQDPRLRYNEAVDLGERVRRTGLEVVFDPSTIVQHLQIEVRGARRRAAEIRSSLSRLAYRHATRSFR